MKKAIYILLLFFALPFLAFSQKKDEKAIRKTFENYKKALLNDNGKQAADCIDKTTLEYYVEMIEIAKKADSIAIKSFSSFNKRIVLIIHERISVEKSASFNAKKLFAYLIDNRLIAKNEIEQISIGEIIIEGNFAKAYYGEEYVSYCDFTKEKGQWKINLVTPIPRL